ncbi:MAG: HNH endonuclease [Candidatus Schekmanbacteria bacterium]|nr:HNH endonuclease [Candidatus Schekmanbacteria bacterium]
MSVLAQEVLVLNRNFAAIRIVPAKEAIGLLFRRVAEVVLAEDGSMSVHNIESWVELSAMRELFAADGRWIGAPSRSVRVPTVIRLPTFARLPPLRVRFNRRNIVARDEGRCQYCGSTFPAQDLSFDHVVPRSRGGRTCWENIVCACFCCNQRKGDRTPEEAGMPLIRRPTRPRRCPLLAARLSRGVPRTWHYFVDEAYWGASLEHD